MRINKYVKLGVGIVLAAVVITVIAVYIAQVNPAILTPKGLIASAQKDLIVFAILLSMVVVVPVFILTFFIAWRYREGNTKAKYTPDWDGNRVVEALWWFVPFVLISVLGVVTWVTSHDLDPFRPIASSVKPIKIQVVALQWKWLFIYPEQNVASVNWVQFPAKTPVDFEITSDAPMNSFWIPQLGGQIYAMSGMSTQLHLVANELGDYRGVSANLSGEGFAGMTFTARASSEEDFNAWARTAQLAPDRLSMDAYTNLAKPSKNDPTSLFASVEQGLYNKVVNKFAPFPQAGHGMSTE